MHSGCIARSRPFSRSRRSPSASSGRGRARSSSHCSPISACAPTSWPRAAPTEVTRIASSTRSSAARPREYGAAAAALRQQLDAALAARGRTIEDAIRSEGRHQAAEQATMASLIGSLRLISAFDWSEFFESVSLVEQVLQRDPAGVYGRMDFRSRDRYRQAVEELADPSGEGQLLLALKSVERARQAHG